MLAHDALRCAVVSSAEGALKSDCRVVDEYTLGPVELPNAADVSSYEAFCSQIERTFEEIIVWSLSIQMGQSGDND